MVQVVENRSEIRGTVRARTAHTELPGWDLLVVHLEAAAPVEGVADLLSGRVGQDLELGVLQSLLPQEDVVGWTLRCRASLAGPGVVLADKDPAPGSFELTPRTS